MSVILPFLALLVATAFAAYHRLRLAYWAAITITALVACWLLGANPAATVVAAVLVALIAIPLLIPGERFNATIVRYLRFARDFNERFPGFETDIHGLVKQMVDGKPQYYVDCVR